MTAIDTLVLGIGNLLASDDAVGVWAAESLKRLYEFPDNVEVVEGGTLGLDLLPRFDGIDRLLVIDSVKLGAQPGMIVRLAGEDIARSLELKVSPHQVGLMDLLTTARLVGCEPATLVCWGIVPECIDPGTGFSPTVTAALPGLMRSVIDELRRWNVTIHSVANAAPPSIYWQKAPRRGTRQT